MFDSLFDKYDLISLNFKMLCYNYDFLWFTKALFAEIPYYTGIQYFLTKEPNHKNNVFVN